MYEMSCQEDCFLSKPTLWGADMRALRPASVDLHRPTVGLNRSTMRGCVLVRSLQGDDQQDSRSRGCQFSLRVDHRVRQAQDRDSRAGPAVQGARALATGRPACWPLCVDAGVRQYTPGGRRTADHWRVYYSLGSGNTGAGQSLAGAPGVATAACGGSAGNCQVAVGTSQRESRAKACGQSTAASEV